MEEPRASPRRLVLAADDDRRRIERDLHQGVQQHLVALAVNLELLAQLIDADPLAASALVETLRRDVQQALDETAQLAQRIYPPLLEERGLAAALRAAAVTAGTPAAVDVAARCGYPVEAARTVYLCWTEALARAGARPAIAVRHDGRALVFDVSCDEADDGRFEGLQERVEALGGRLTISPDRVSGSIPVDRCS